VTPQTFGRYRILGELGRGAMGAVYRAADPLIEREVAIKTLLPHLPPEVMEEVRGRFVREARSAGRLNHPNIVTVYDVGEQDGIAYIAMELLEGRSLQQMLREPQPLAWSAIAELAAQVADALEHAHSFKIVHRDVKPANVMVTPSGRAKLTDFGVAYVPSSTMTQTGAALGSPRYMSPEQVLGQAIDPRSDIFSLGVVLYEMLTRRTPFERTGDSNVFALMNRIAGEPHVPLRELDAGIPPGFERIMQRALAKKPAERYQRAGEMAGELRAFERLGPPPPRAAAPADAAATVIAAPSLAGRSAAQTLASVASPEDEKTRTQLLNDLEQFAQNFEREEQERLRAEAEERARREQALRLWAQSEARKREEFEREQSNPSIATATSLGARTQERRAALELLRQQASKMAPQENKAAARARAAKELDQHMRAAFQYLSEFGRELNGVSPAAARPYEFMYIGRLPGVALGEAFVDSRPLRVDGNDLCARVFMRYRVTPSRPASATLLGADIERAPKFLQALQVPFELKPAAKNDFGATTRATLTVTRPLPCQLELNADYDQLTVSVQLVNVRLPGRVQCVLAPEQLPECVDELARFVLGADDEFAKRLPGNARR
jgi:hypothetical protein